MITKVKRTTVLHTRIILTGKDILRLLSASNRVKITKETEVFINIPTGGDYSGMRLDIDKECPIIVSSKFYDKKR
jgi:hypothetical protein